MNRKAPIVEVRMNPKKESQPATESTLRRFIRQMPGSSSGGRSCFALRGKEVGLIWGFAGAAAGLGAVAGGGAVPAAVSLLTGSAMN